MKQILEDLRDGRIWVEETPPPQLRPGFVLVRNHSSLISSGTEGGTVKLGKMGLLAKARARPEQAMKVLQLARTQGPFTAYSITQRALETPIVLGYSSAGTVVAVGEGVEHLRVGDRVACAGQGYASHAEIVSVPKRLCVRVPDGVELEHAAFSTVGAIALQSVRVADVRLGDRVVVIGLGLIGLLVAQLLRAAGCIVLGIDFDAARLALARERGWAETARADDANLLERVLGWSSGAGADAVIVTAATDDAGPIERAGEYCRRKGRVIVVGRTEMRLPRESFLFKELELRTSMAYGPGTGDPNYELAGHDYPLAYVRWTEERNMAAFLEQVAFGTVDIGRMVTHRFDLDRAADAFALISGESREPSIGIVLGYPPPADAIAPLGPLRVVLPGEQKRANGTKRPRIAVVGSGGHATNEFLPALARCAVELRGIASATGVRATALGRKYSFAYASADVDEVIADPHVDAVMILTRHDTHADLAARALAAGKDVFVEKPLALSYDELARVEGAFTAPEQMLMVGFNRRYAPLAQRLRASFAARSQPMSICYRANVGSRPPEHWLHHPREGGGVILGEACHHLDFCSWLVGAAPVEVQAHCVGGNGAGYLREDNVHVTLAFPDGSLATVLYLSNGAKSFPTETIEVSCDNRSARLTDFRKLEIGRGFGRRTERCWSASAKGLAAQIEAFVSAIAVAGVDRVSYLASSRLALQVDAAVRAAIARAAQG